MNSWNGTTPSPGSFSAGRLSSAIASILNLATSRHGVFIRVPFSTAQADALNLSAFQSGFRADSEWTNKWPVYGHSAQGHEDTDVWECSDRDISSGRQAGLSQSPYNRTEQEQDGLEDCAPARFRGIHNE